MALVFDVETDGLLDELTKIHCLVIKDTESMTCHRFNHQGGGTPRIEDGLNWLMEYAASGGKIVGHNVIGFDIPAIQKVYPWFHVPRTSVIDTMVYARAQWPDLKEHDQRLVRRGRFPGNLVRKPHSLEAWGHRLGEYKDDFKGPWDKWTQEMEDYCEQDVEVTDRLFLHCVKHHQSDELLHTEHQVARILRRQEAYGFAFDQQEAVKLYARLVQRRQELTAELQQVFRPFYVSAGALVPKRDNRTQGYVAGVPLNKVKLREFNPASRDHIVNRLKKLYGWIPMEYTDDGKPKMDEAVIAELDYPGVPLLKEYLLIDKRIGQIAEGKEAWLKRVGSDGRMHGYVNGNGAVTGRMTHSKPNMGQVPAVYSPYGKECRALFVASPGKVLVGCDADALELRDLAGYMAAYDDGAYIETVLRGDKAKGTDMHSVNCRALGMDPKAVPPALAALGRIEKGRDVAKTWFYAFVYGAGDAKLGTILTGKKGTEAVAAGKKSRAAFLRNLPALGRLVERVRSVAKQRGFLRGLDGRHLDVRSQHAALNTLLQSAGAVQMKKALCILDEELQAMGLVPGVDYEYVANVHDEWQIECRTELGETIGRIAADAIRKAGEHFKFRCPLAGEYKLGRTWAETH